MEGAAGNVCAGTCLEVWCDSGEVGEHTLRDRQMVQVVDRCTNCEQGDLDLSRGAFQGLSTANTYWVMVHWRCVHCATSFNSSAGSNDVRAIAEAVCPESGSRMEAAPVNIGDGIVSGERGETTEGDMTYGGGDSFSELDYSAFDTSSSFDAEIEMPSSDNSNDSDSSNSNGESNNNSEGVKKNNDISESGSTNEFLSDSGYPQTDTKPWTGQGQKTAPPILSWPSSTIPSYRPSSSSSISGTSSSSPTLTVASGSSNGVPWSVPLTLAPSGVGSSFSVFQPASTSGDSDYPVGNSRNLGLSTSGRRPV